jgi:ketosteroid isomerase-like protein
MGSELLLEELEMKKPIVAMMLLGLGMLVFSACEPAGTDVAGNNAAVEPAATEEAKPAGITEAEVTKALGDLLAAVKAGDAEALGKIYADDYVIVSQTGAIETKQQRLDSLKSGTVKYEKLEFKNPKIRTYGTVAVVNMEAVGTGEMSGRSVELNTRATLIFNKGASGVQEVSSHLTEKAKE